MKRTIIFMATLAFCAAGFAGCGGKGAGEKEKNCRALHKRLEVCNLDLEDDQKILKRQVADPDRFLATCVKNYSKGRTVKMIGCLSKSDCGEYLTCIEHRPRRGMGPAPDEDIEGAAEPTRTGDMTDSKPDGDMPPPPADMPTP